MTGHPHKRQEQEPASPEVAEVAPGVLRIQLPVGIGGLGHVNCYGLTDHRGIALVDPGMPGAESAATLEKRLADAGYERRHVHTVVVTHSHIDHFGGAHAFIRDGAEVVGHELLRNWWDPSPDVDLVTDDEGRRAADGEAGAAGTTGGAGYGGEQVSRDADGRLVSPWTGRTWTPQVMETERIAALRAMDPDFYRAPRPTTKLADADSVRLAGRDWVAVWTPGHTPDHLCLYDPTEGVLLSGDHVLPTITPHISGISAGPDPLAGFFSSLERMHELPGVRSVLPAHGHPFTQLDERVDAIRQHHEARLGELRTALARVGPATVTDLSHELFRERSWGPLAESETYAHLEHLRLAGEATRDELAGVLTYTATSPR